MPGSEGQLPTPSPDAIPRTDVPVPMAEQIKSLPDLSTLSGMDELGELKQRQDNAEDALFARGAHNPSIAAAEARAAVEDAHSADSPLSLGEAIVTTAKSSEGLTFANSPMHAVRLGGPNNLNRLPTSPGGLRSPDTGSTPPETTTTTTPPTMITSEQVPISTTEPPGAKIYTTIPKGQ